MSDVPLVVSLLVHYSRGRGYDVRMYRCVSGEGLLYAAPVDAVVVITEICASGPFFLEVVMSSSHGFLSLNPQTASITLPPRAQVFLRRERRPMQTKLAAAQLSGPWPEVASS